MGANEGLFSYELLSKPKVIPSCPLVQELAFHAAPPLQQQQQLESWVYLPVIATRARVSTTAFRNILGSSLGCDSLGYTG